MTQRTAHQGIDEGIDEGPFLVIGGTGTTGRRVVAGLRARGVAVRVGSRSGTPPFAWHDRATWDAVLTGARAVHVVPLDGTMLTRPLLTRAVAVAALTEDGHAGRVHELSGPRALTLAEVAGEIAAVTGRPLRYVPLTVAEYTAERVARGWSAADAAYAAETFSPLCRGLDSHLSPGVREALGREPRDFAAFARQAVAEGAWDT
ncbi:hypothetical protein [Streptomyces radicis]|uniref:NmrA family transcriptional regulator n=1 Tax=Streptomyces radicis TaxID=1750517 RepID=A0A3A9WCP8_9ACTN|nr:hypothetical protein [Streptomyces radicis]RKN05416.1 hypothetical protein D7319_25630 [Streptomyces radicis]RKN16923.1 hypothetical protein D7318_24995 [Streptomyces radicis]